MVFKNFNIYFFGCLSSDVILHWSSSSAKHCFGHLSLSLGLSMIRSAVREIFFNCYFEVVAVLILSIFILSFCNLSLIIKFEHCPIFHFFELVYQLHFKHLLTFSWSSNCLSFQFEYDPISGEPKDGRTEAGPSRTGIQMTLTMKPGRKM